MKKLKTISKINLCIILMGSSLLSFGDNTELSIDQFKSSTADALQEITELTITSNDTEIQLGLEDLQKIAALKNLTSVKMRTLPQSVDVPAAIIVGKRLYTHGHMDF